MIQKLAIEQIVELNPEDIVKALVPSERFKDKLKEKVFDKSIEQFGIIYPVIVTPNAQGKFTVVDGSKRVEKAKEKKIKVPALIKNYDEQTALLVSLFLNFARRSVSMDELSWIVKKIKYPSMLREIGFNTSQIHTLKNLEKVKDVVKDLWSPSEVSIEVAKIGLIDKKKGEEVATLVKRNGAMSKEDVEKLKDRVDQMKAGIACSLCGRNLNREEVNWVALCSSCKWTLIEEFKETIYDKKIKDWLSGKFYNVDEVLVVSKEKFKELLEKIPDDVRINSGVQAVYERLVHEMGSS